MKRQCRKDACYITGAVALDKRARSFFITLLKWRNYNTDKRFPTHIHQWDSAHLPNERAMQKGCLLYHRRDASCIIGSIWREWQGGCLHTCIKWKQHKTGVHFPHINNIVTRLDLLIDGETQKGFLLFHRSRTYVDEKSKLGFDILLSNGCSTILAIPFPFTNNIGYSRTCLMNTQYRMDAFNVIGAVAWYERDNREEREKRDERARSLDLVCFAVDSIA